MKKKLQLQDDEQELEILKAVAQAWQSHSGSSRPMSEFDARRRNYKGILPSKFKLEAMRKSASSSPSARWDFGQSLWDAYELVAVSKRLESGLVLDEVDGSSSRVHRRSRESKNSLRNLFDKRSSRRYNSDEVEIPDSDDTF